MSVYREPTRIEEYVNEGCDHLIEDFRDKRVIRSTLAAWLAPGDDIEAALFAMVDALQLETTTNTEGLNVLGAYVGEARRGRSFESFRKAIKVRIRINRSRGLADDILEVADLLAESFTYTEYYPAGIIVHVDEGDDPVLFADAMRRTKAGGISLQTSFATVPQENLMRYGSALHPSNGVGAGTTISSVPYRTMAHVRIY